MPSDRFDEKAKELFWETADPLTAKSIASALRAQYAAGAEAAVRECLTQFEWEGMYPEEKDAEVARVLAAIGGKP